MITATRWKSSRGIAALIIILSMAGGRIGKAAGIDSARDMKLISVTTGVEDTNGCGEPGPSASTGSFVVLDGTDTDAGCGDDTIWHNFLNSRGKSINKLALEDEGGKATPTLASANDKTGEVTMLGYWEWKSPPIGTIWVSTAGADRYRTLVFSDENGKPLAVANLNDGTFAMVHEGRRDVTIYKANYERGRIDKWYRVKLDDEDLPTQMKTLKSMVYDPYESALYIGGNVKGGNRGLARINVLRDRSKVDWVTSIDAQTGTARLELRRSAFDKPAHEVLLLSRSFYARIRTEDGSQPYLYATSKAYLPFLPEGESPRATYDPTRDVIWTVSETRLRMHSADTGKSAGGYLMLPYAGEDDLEFYHDPPKDWDVSVKDDNPGTDLSQHPPNCGDTEYPNHPNIPDGKFADVDETQCTVSGSCPYEAPPYGASCTNSEICCANGGCCILDPSSYFENWGRFPYAGPGVGSRSVHVTADGKVNVVVQFSGYVDDEENYYRLSLASFGDAATDDSTEECTDQTSKTDCREMVTRTGCYWSKTKGCINAKKCSKIKKNQDACIGATEHDCAWWKRSETKFVCNDDTIEKGCSTARDKAACDYNGCSWSPGGVCFHDKEDNDNAESEYFMVCSNSLRCANHRRIYNGKPDTRLFNEDSYSSVSKRRIETLFSFTNGRWKPFTNIPEKNNRCVVVGELLAGEALYVIDDCGDAKGANKKWQFNSDKTISLVQEPSLCVKNGKRDKSEGGRGDGVDELYLEPCDSDSNTFIMRELEPLPEWYDRIIDGMVAVYAVYS